MALIKLHGVHGTCITHAKSILANGVKAKSGGGRAGTGFYLWAYATDSGRKRAIQLAKDWHSDWYAKGKYDGSPERGEAIIVFDILVESTAYLNLNQTRHHERLLEIEERTGQEQSKVFDEYLESQSLFKEEQHQTPLQVVEAMVPYPEATKRSNLPRLTPGGDAYIILEPGFGTLEIVEWWPTALRKC